MLHVESDASLVWHSLECIKVSEQHQKNPWFIRLTNFNCYVNYFFDEIDAVSFGEARCFSGSFQVLKDFCCQLFNLRILKIMHRGRPDRWSLFICAYKNASTNFWNQSNMWNTDTIRSLVKIDWVTFLYTSIWMHRSAYILLKLTTNV